jgi:GNAT superfamily N-acetyltransferase
LLCIRPPHYVSVRTTNGDNVSQTTHRKHSTHRRVVLQGVESYVYVASGVSFEDVKRAIADWANTDRIPLAVVALDGGRVIGTGCLKAHDMDTRMELTPWLVGIYVELKQRRKGIGSKLVITLEDIAKNLGTQRLYLYTPQSAGFTARLGWAEYERTTYKGLGVTGKCPASLAL